METSWSSERAGWVLIAMAVGLVVALLIFRTFAFNHRNFDNSGGGVPINVAPESSSASDPGPQNAGTGDVGGVKDHP
jgi:hypothetical protein